MKNLKNHKDHKDQEDSKGINLEFFLIVWLYNQVGLK